MTNSQHVEAEIEPSPTRASPGVPLLEVDNLTVRFRSRRRTLWQRRTSVAAVDDVSLCLDEGETLGIVGESGSGKSTLCRAILRLIEPLSGEVRLRGAKLSTLSRKELNRARRDMQIVFQDPYSSFNPRMRIADILTEPLHVHDLYGSSTQAALDALEAVGLSGRITKRFPHELSGGQLQRVGLARALILRPSLVVLDESVSALDVSVQAQILDLLMDLQAELRLAYLFVSHDLSVISEISDRVAVMYLGQVVETGPTQEVFAAPRHPYTKALLSAVPIPDPVHERERRRIVLSGDPPSPSDLPSGCRFAERCWLRERLEFPGICLDEEPGLRAVGCGHPARCHFSDAQELGGD